MPGEQLGLGGAASVRGYREREVAGDRGAAVAVEMLGPDVGAAFGSADFRLRPLAFLDYGHVANRGAAPCGRGDSTSCTLAGTGIGVRFAHGSRVTGRLDVARALRDGPLSVSGGTRGHVALNVVF